VFPELFKRGDEYLELLLPNNLLSQDSIIRKLETIPEEDFLNDVEIVGWLYQYYVASNREEFRKAKVVTKDLIPTLSQIFTPDWIVRYMAENSVGRLWLESYPNSSLRNDLKYYVDDAKQDDETNKKLEEIKYKNVDPEKIKVIEPCSGSGHILVYVFDLLFKMYLEKGYNSKDIPSLILKNNLYGLDIDKRAAQLAQFSLIMKARSIDNRFFNEDRFVRPRVFEIIDSKLLKETNYRESMKSLHFSEDSIKMVDFLYDTFENAKIIGSLLKVPARDYSGLMDDIKRCKENEYPNLLEMNFFNAGIDCIKYLVKVAITLSRKYDVMITNPPYLGTGTLEKEPKEYLYNNYPFSKSDFFTMFMKTNFVKTNGLLAIVNPDSWLFLKTYSDLRVDIINNMMLVNCCHMGMGAFDAVVQTQACILRNSQINKYDSTFIRMIDNIDFTSISTLKDIGSIYTKQIKSFKAITNCPFIYWIYREILDVFNMNENLDNFLYVKNGMSTTDNNRFLRFWPEVNINKICFNAKDRTTAKQTNLKWFPYNKGGEFRKWYGNMMYIVNWEDDGKEIRKNAEGASGGRIVSEEYYFNPSISWSKISSGQFSCRLYENGYLFDVAGPSIFGDRDKQYYALALMNSKLKKYYIESIAPTLNYERGQVSLFPIIIDDSSYSKIIELSRRNVELSKNEWNSYEFSWGFLKHNLVMNISISKISDAYNQYLQCAKERFSELKDKTEQINEIALKLYDVCQYDTSSENNSDITLRIDTKVDSIKSLISYFIGCIMGRYSLEQEGLVYAGGTFDASKYGDYVDADGVVPIYRFVGIEDGLTTSICNMVKRVYGDTYYKENLDFIAEALGRKPEEGAEEAINRYLNDGFYDDHVKIYQKRPIYWMLSSGKQGAFKCLIYLHRYNKNTLALINTKYFLPRTAMYKAERERLEFKLVNADIREKKKIEKELTNIEACEEELLEYGQVLDHMANQFIDIDLDDGVKVNYVKFQGVELEVNGARIKKNLLVPFGLEEKKK
jgi:hypothetical protein